MQELNVKKKPKRKRKWVVLASAKFTNGRSSSMWYQRCWLLGGSYLFVFTHKTHSEKILNTVKIIPQRYGIVVILLIISRKWNNILTKASKSKNG